MLRIVLGASGAVLTAAVVALNLSPIGQIYLPSATGIVAKQMCSLTWVSGLDPDQAKSLYLDPLLGDAGSVLSYSMDEESHEVSASLLGLFWTQRAVWRDGLGCTLVQGGHGFDPDLTVPIAHDFIPMPLDTAHRDTWFDTEALDTAIASAVDDSAQNSHNTLGIAVLHQGHLVAEYYAPGASAETRFHGWSMTKSVIATLAGSLVEDGLLDIRAEGDIPALAAVGDPQLSDITIESLLRMTGGLAIAELNNGMDPNSQMLFTQWDMPHFAATRERLYAPSEHWQYMSGNTILAADTMQRRLGDSLPEQITALRARIFEPLDIYSAIMEPGENGTFQGSSYMYATAQDWARLGQLYLDNGVANGTRILPEGWYSIVAEPTPHSGGGYGMGFWLPTEATGLPRETIMMSGFQGQWGYVMPEQELVIVRFGATVGVSSRSGRLAREIVASLRPPLAAQPDATATQLTGDQPG
ncbi:serine hydrolase [uncultured Maricaulis sp.]|uniref:serine hydrolase domain-containing protein n=1 Tax=uncultured Maricaulis sp. TaxID=174710 RepID=UPI0030D93CD1|tara:strand:- start:4249 stop:5658 length:1410 start_codon:yes stop_codon:yes gene_type:complete